MRTNLVLYLNEENFDFKNLCNAVYTSTAQRESLSAELVFLSSEEIKELNYEKRNINAVTDVLSFPSLNVKDFIVTKKGAECDIDEHGRIFIGSIAICLERAREQANEYGHSFERELNYLLCHGLLHLLGYDHVDEGDKVIMRAKEEEILGKIKVTR